MTSDKTILLVEDNPADEALTQRALKKARVESQVIVARDGAEALDHLFGAKAGETCRKLPDLILLDLKLPKLDGHEVLKRIRADVRTQAFSTAEIKVRLAGRPETFDIPH